MKAIMGGLKILSKAFCTHVRQFILLFYRKVGYNGIVIRRSLHGAPDGEVLSEAVQVMTVSPAPSVWGLIGHPLGHSLSPRLHALLSGLTGFAMDYRLYDLPALGAPEMDEFLGSPAFGGLNVTIPYKQAVIPFLDRLDESARRYGSVNTIARVNGAHVGYNTDCIGFSRSIQKFGDIRSAAIIGPGGVGRTFAIELARRGAAVTLGARPSSMDRAQTLAREIVSRFGTSVDVQSMDALNLTDEEGKYTLLVNASPSGMFPHTQECPASETLIRSCLNVFDSVYNPAETRLCALARKWGVPVAGGMRMLAWQGAAAQEIWYAAQFSDEQISAVERKLYTYMERPGS